MKLALISSWLWFDGEHRSTSEPVDYLGLLARLTAHRAAAAGRPAAATCELELDGSPDPEVLRGVLGVVAGAGYERLELGVGGRRFDLHLLEGSGHEPGAPPARRTALMLRRDGIAAWAGEEAPFDAGAPADPRLEKSFAASWGEPDAVLEEGLARVCEAGGCSPLVVYFDAALAGAPLLRVLGALRAVDRAHAGATPPVFALGVDAPPAPGEEAQVFIGRSPGAGTLPPEVIRQVVRGSYASFRGCYSRALARAPQLQGWVAARFVIGPDGRVADVADGGSDLPAEVSGCVRAGFRQLRFPTPRGGPVTVQYPILFQP